MPDEKYEISEEVRRAASDFINEKAQHANDPCPHCGDTNTSVANHIFRISVGYSPIAQAFVPVLPVVCNNCGFVRIFSATMVGIVPPPAEGE